MIATSLILLLVLLGISIPVAAALGVTKPYLYYYFHNKQEIFETLCWRPSSSARSNTTRVGSTSSVKRSTPCGPVSRFTSVEREIRRRSV